MIVEPHHKKRESVPIFTATIPGRPIVKKNTQRVVGFGRAKRVIYSPAYLRWRATAYPILIALARKLNQPIDGVIQMNITFYLKNKQAEPDLSALIEGAQDEMAAAGVIVDDRIIHTIYARKFFGEEPRTEIELYQQVVGDAS